MREQWRQRWPVDLLAVVVLLVVLIFGSYLSNRQRLADQRNERYRRDLCAILSTIPGAVPPQIAKARKDFARPHHPHDCQPITRIHPTPRPTPTVTATVMVPQPGPTRTVEATPSPQVTVTRTPAPRPKPSRSPKPNPSPSRTCITVVCLR